MKKLLFIIVILLVSSIFHSCEKETLDETLLWRGNGKWRCSEGCFENALHEYWRYFSNNNGYTWVEDEDIYEDEAQKFTWKLVKSELEQIHILEMGGVVPKIYTVTELTATRLRYKDIYGTSTTFEKVE